MDQKNLNFIVATCAFVLGAIFVLSNPRDITGNVIGASGPGATLTVVMGVVLIIASSAFFMFTINHEDTHLERLLRETKNHEEVKVQLKEQETKEKYKEK